MTTSLPSNEMLALFATMGQSISFIYLNTRMESEEKSKAQIMARSPFSRFIKCFVTFKDVQKCEEHIRRSKDDLILLGVTEYDGKIIVPRVHELPQVIVITFYCLHVADHKKWADKYDKVDVYSPIEQTMEEIAENQRLHGKIEEPVSFPNFTYIDHEDEHTSIELAGEYQFLRLLVETFLKMESTEAERQEFVTVCSEQYKGKQSDLRTIQEFQHTYSSDQAIHWYTKDTFLFRLLNKALRMHNVDLLILFQFFIKDICQQLHKLQSEQFSAPVLVYRGQKISNQELGRLLSIEGQIISMNSFFSTTRNRNLALLYLDTGSSPIDGFQFVLFEMLLDPRFSDRQPFADITALSNFPEEEETLLMLGSIFRLEKMDLKDGIWIIQLSQCDDTDLESQALLHYRSREIDNENPLYSLSVMLSNFGKCDAAERFYLRYLRQLPENHPHVFWCYLGLGCILEAIGKDNESLRMYEAALAFVKQIYSSDNPLSVFVYSGMGKVYTNIRNYEQAMTYQRKALSILELLGEENDPVARCLKLIGDILGKGLKNYEEALRTYQRVLSIREKIDPPNHPNIATAHMDVGGIYGLLGQFNLAFKHLNRCLQMLQKSLPPDHPEIGATYYVMGLAYSVKKDFSESLNAFEKAISIYRRNSLPPDYPPLVHALWAIHSIKESLSAQSLWG